MTVLPFGARVLTAAALLLTSACWRSRQAAPEPAVQEPSAPAPMHSIPVYEIAPSESGIIAMTPSRQRDPIADLGASKPITLTANDANARTLLLTIAREAGVNLVVSPDVSARVSVSFTNLPASEAIRTIIAQAGLSILTGGLQNPWPPAVFYQLPVNIDRASVETIVARFGVSTEMAKFLVESRKP